MPYFDKRHREVVKKVLEKLRLCMYTPVAPLKAVCYRTKEPVTYENRMCGEYKELNIGDEWGEQFDCAWFHFTGKIPESCAGEKVVVAIDVNGEGLIFDDEGVPVRGITCISYALDNKKGTGSKRIYIVAEEAKGGEDVDIWMDAGCNALFGNYKAGGLEEANIAVQNDIARAAYYDTFILDDLLDTLDPKSSDYTAILYGMYEASLGLKIYSPEEIAEYGKTVRALYRKGGEGYLKFIGMGHAHIDLGWLWPVRESHRKGARSFATALYLMDRYPWYKFGASQPQLYQWIKEDHPKLYEKVKQKVKEGRWEAQGAMWVEADTNLSGGEALVRQLIHGKRFFRDEFGVEVKNLWLPDVFGYCGSLPQILKKAEVDYFVTQKLSWNQHNRFPHHTFMWQGIDGTQIFSHMLPEDTYNGPLRPTFLKHAEKNYNESHISDEAMILFGVGDGGGGPGTEHLERYLRVKNLRGVCPIENDFAQPHLERVEQKTRGKLATWAGELYLERHQGTYTSQALNKYYNRKSEFALREVEFALELCGEKDYPREKLDKIWKEVLLYQFHDIIPGSSIKRVYDESRARYREMLSEINEIIENSYKKVANGKKTVFNSLSWDRTEVINCDGQPKKAVIPALGYTSVFSDVDLSGLEIGENSIENENLKVIFDEDGALVSLFDKKYNREALSAKSNMFAIYEDTDGDCWDIDILYTDKSPEYFSLIGSETYLEGAKAICKQYYQYNSSTLTAEISLVAGGEILEVKLHADWHENEKMLRVSVNADILSDHTNFEIPYGKISRANNDNTSWQRAQFEVCGHKWVDISQSDYGVALLNDCKYGFRTIGKCIDMNLLRSQNTPGENADRGEHDIVYAIYPHIGNESEGEVSKKAYELNSPIRIIDGEIGNSCGQMFKVDGKIVVESIKRAENSETYVIRAFEPYGNNANATFTFNEETTLTESNFLENPVAEPVSSEVHPIRFKPFEIKTFIVGKD